MFLTLSYAQTPFASLVLRKAVWMSALLSPQTRWKRLRNATPVFQTARNPVVSRTNNSS